MPVEAPHWNLLVVVCDTLRTAYLGCYGNNWVRTPNFDRMAAEGTRFTRAHPEALPTIPTRRTLHTGRRAFPFASWSPVPWDNVYLPGWQPMSPDEGTLAEALAASGYHTGFVSDVPHYFVPGMNFTRGFCQWQFTRGQAEDRWGAVAAADLRLLDRYAGGNPHLRRAQLVNVRPELPESEWPAPRTFRWAIDFLEANARNQPFYLYLDTFTPHETWQAPRHYHDLYGDPDAAGPIWLTLPYSTLDKHPQVAEALPEVRAHYAGLVTMVDTWFGRLMETLDRLGLRESTLVVLTSDHGTNHGDNAEGVLGKPAAYLTPGTMDIPLLVRHPAGLGAGRTDESMVYTLDVPALLADAAGVTVEGGLAGQSLLPLLDGGSRFAQREYLTCRYGNTVWYRDDRTWYYGGVNGGGEHLYDLSADPTCSRNLAGLDSARSEAARAAILADAGGSLVEYHHPGGTDALGRPLTEARQLRRGRTNR